MTDETRRDAALSEGESRLHESGPKQGRVSNAPPAGTTPSHARPTFSDPVPGNIDPTSPASPENTMPYDRENVANDGTRVSVDPNAPGDHPDKWRYETPDSQT